MTHPITPPPELVEEWIERFKGDHPIYVAMQAAQWGADQELEACCKWLQCEAGNAVTEFIPGDLRAARRPKPPSLKEQALAILASVAVCELHGDAAPDNRLSTKDIDTIRRALEALSDD